MAGAARDKLEALQLSERSGESAWSQGWAPCSSACCTCAKRGGCPGIVRIPPRSTRGREDQWCRQQSMSRRRPWSDCGWEEWRAATRARLLGAAQAGVAVDGGRRQGEARPRRRWCDTLCSRDARIELSYPNVPQSRRGFQPPQARHRDFDNSYGEYRPPGRAQCPRPASSPTRGWKPHMTLHSSQSASDLPGLACRPHSRPPTGRRAARPHHRPLGQRRPTFR